MAGGSYARGTFFGARIQISCYVIWSHFAVVTIKSAGWLLMVWYLYGTRVSGTVLMKYIYKPVGVYKRPNVMPYCYDITRPYCHCRPNLLPKSRIYCWNVFHFRNASLKSMTSAVLLMGVFFHSLQQHWKPIFLSSSARTLFSKKNVIFMEGVQNCLEMGLWRIYSIINFLCVTRMKDRPCHAYEISPTLSILERQYARPTSRWCTWTRGTQLLNHVHTYRFMDYVNVMVPHLPSNQMRDAPNPRT